MNTQAILRNPLLIPAAIILTGAAMFGLGRALHVDPHVMVKRDLAAGVLATSIASALGFLPAWIFPKSAQATLANASLGGTLLHTLVTVGMGMAWWLTGKSGNLNGFWTILLVLYWVSLAALATVTITMVKGAGIKPARSVAAKPTPIAATVPKRPS